MCCSCVANSKAPFLQAFNLHLLDSDDGRLIKALSTCPRYFFTQLHISTNFTQLHSNYIAGAILLTYLARLCLTVMAVSQAGILEGKKKVSTERVLFFFFFKRTDALSRLCLRVPDMRFSE